MKQPMINEYDVYYHKYASAMSEDETVVEDSTETGEEDTDTGTPTEQEATPVELDGYKTLFDTKVALTPVELVPAGTHTPKKTT